MGEVGAVSNVPNERAYARSISRDPRARLLLVRGPLLTLASAFHSTKEHAECDDPRQSAVDACSAEPVCALAAAASLRNCINCNRRSPSRVLGVGKRLL